MKNVLLFFSLFSILTALSGCESYHQDSAIQEEQERPSSTSNPGPATPEHGGNAGNR